MAVPLGFAAVAQCWSASRPILHGVPRWTVDAFWLTSAALAGVLLVGCLGHLAKNGWLGVEARDPTLGPFLALTPLLLMVYGPAIAAHHEGAGRAVFFAGLVLIAALGCWLIGWWIRGGVPLESFHPGYLLPTALGGLVVAASASLLGYWTIAQLSFGWGLISWILIGSVVLGRLALAARCLPG